MLKEFKEFAMKGSVVDLAVGVIIGAAFGGLVKSFVDDILMPIVGWIFGGFDFTNFFIQLAGAPATTLDAARENGAVLAYGNFITLIVNFAIVAFVLFLVIRAINSAKKKEEEAPAAPAEPPRDEVLLEEIRDLLKK